jgi:transposase
MIKPFHYSELMIKNKQPLGDRWSTIYIQQDNAKTHVTCDDPVVVAEEAKGNWDISMVFQPPNSPDMNILDLGWFCSIQAMFQQKMPKLSHKLLPR